MSKANLYDSSGIAMVPNLFTERGGFQYKTNLQKIEENIRIALMTSRGTTPGNPDFGSDLYKLLQYGANSATATRIRYEIDRVFEKEFPELSIDSIDVEFIGSTIKIYLYYRIKYSNVNSNVTMEFIQGGDDF